ncbi:hypothetical protein OF83DRAFT_729379 [Amylostereum chailletii]|nr:hypothetical protein OF83DRAFT_729379 [Amylostereum chailletii]
MSSSTWLTTPYAYIDIPNANLICCIFQNPFVNPTTTRTCAHTFCRDCIVQALRTSSQCPIDRSPLSTRDLVQATPVVRDMVEELIVECWNRADGCQHTCQRALLHSHMKDDCDFSTVACSNAECDQEVLRKDAKLSCTHRVVDDASTTATTSTDTVQCTDCSSTFPNPASLSSHSSSCPSSEVSCPHNTHGCHWRARLENENKALRQRLDASEGLVRVLMGEMAVMKRALGPLFTLDEVCAPAPAPTHSEPQREEPASIIPARGLDDITSYFPPALPPSPREDGAAYAYPSPTTFEASHPAPTLPQVISGPSRPPASSPLHTQLSALYSTVEAVATEQEALRRDADAAHAQLGGEVGAIRAALGGVRMLVSEVLAVVNGVLADHGKGEEAGGGVVPSTNGLAVGLGGWGAFGGWPGRVPMPPPHLQGYGHPSMQQGAGAGPYGHTPSLQGSISVKL